MDMQVILVIAIIFIAFGGEAVFGFGGGLIAIPLLSLLLGVRDAVTLALVFQVAMGLLILGNYRQINWKIANPISISLILGTIVGTLYLAAANTSFLQLFLASAIVLFLIKTIFFKDFKIRNTKNPVMTSINGLTSGLFQGLIGIGGPILTMYLSVAIPKKAQFRATIIYLLFLICVVRLVISIPQGLFTGRIIELSLYAAPFFLAAIALGQIFHTKIKEKYYWSAIYVILLVASISLFAKALV